MNQEHEITGSLGLDAALSCRRGVESSLKFTNVYRFECFDKQGRLKWVEEVKNLVTTEGLNHALDVVFKSGAQLTSWFVGLIDNSGFSAIAAADTLASHAGWTEATGYTGNRQALTLGTISAGSVDNSASKAAFPITGTATINGGFVASVATGTSGILYGAASFSSPRAVENGDTLNVTATLTAASA